MPSTYIYEKFDLGITTTSYTSLGLMLRRNRSELPQYQVYDDEFLASQFFTGSPGYGSLPTEKELAIRQDDWRSGLGLEVYDANDSKRYHKSTMDMRFRGMGIAGWKSTSIARTSAVVPIPTIVNGNMELTTGWTNGARSSEQAHAGTYSWKIVGGQASATQSIVPIIPGATISVVGWAFGASSKIQVSDGITTTDSGTGSAGSWTQVTVNKTMSNVATDLQIILFGAGGDTYYDDVTISVTTPFTISGATSVFCEFNDALYLNVGVYLVKLNATGDGWTFVAEMAATITDLEVMRISGADYLFAALGTSTDCRYMTTTEDFVTSTTTVKRFKYFKVVNAASPTMWGSDGDNTIRSTTNPLNGGTAWSGQTTVDTAYYVITGLVSDGGSLYVMKENRPYYLDSAGAVQSDLAPELEVLTKSTDNGKNAVFWLSKLYLPWGNQSLLEDDTGTNTWRSPALSATSAAEYNGQVFAVVGDDQYLYAILDYTTKIEVLAGRLETIDNFTEWVWHCINETTLTGCETAFISTVYQKRLWIASTASGDSLYYIPLPLGYANIASDTNRDFLTGTTMETPWLHANFKDTTKGFISLELVMGHSYDADVYFTAQYKILGDTTWTSIGNYTGSATSMTQKRFIPADSSSNNPVSTLFKIQFTAVTDDVQVTPILNSYHLKAILYPDQREIIACKAYCANEIQLKDGTIDQGSYDTIIAALDEARTATWPLTISDIGGTSRTVKFLPLPSGVPRWRVLMNEKNRKLEREYNLLMQIVPLS